MTFLFMGTSVAWIPLCLPIIFEGDLVSLCSSHRFFQCIVSHSLTPIFKLNSGDLATQSLFPQSRQWPYFSLGKTVPPLSLKNSFWISLLSPSLCPNCTEICAPQQMKMFSGDSWCPKYFPILCNFIKAC